jgi:CheY-like chemotaxis protein
LTYVDGQVTFALSPLIRGISLARKILLADDSVTAQNMGRKILADAGYEVIAVNNGSAALKKIAEIKPDLVILDVYMPGYSGLEVCQRLKESQETARIPVLLTVGKLEPFKPEEAQRVRAEGFIVKPFEASELLSALSKLEDKVVPRAEPSKPGRFARAIAAAEASDRSTGSEAASEKNGWKSRLGFPHQKTEPEEKVGDEASFYNPMNRDLRTVVETAGEKAAEKAANQQHEEKRQPAASATESSVDVAALAPAGLPKDVTPEEVAAIAAAAAQIQMASAGVKDEPPTSEIETTPTGSSEVQTPEVRIVESQNTDAKSQPSPEPVRDEPVTMAATAESLPAANAGPARWTAVSVALEGDDATTSLEHEMHKAYAAFAAAEADSAVAGAPEVQTASAETSAAPETEAVEAPIATISSPEPEPTPEPEPVISAKATESEPAAPQSEPFAADASLVAAETARLGESANAPAEPSAPPAEANAPPVAESSSQTFTSQTDLAESAAPNAADTQEPRPAAEVEPVIAATTSPSNGSAPAVRSTEPEAESKPDLETVKSTAAAWASWRQIRDTKGSDAVQGKAKGGQPREFEVPESAPAETAARAVAAGAEQSLQEAAAAAPGENPADVASIVDSVLADLRPKLMAEISRKMSEKK